MDVFVDHNAVHIGAAMFRLREQDVELGSAAAAHQLDHVIAWNGTSVDNQMSLPRF